MTAAEMKKVLKKYGIENQKQFDEALRNFKGVDIGIFVSAPRKEKRNV